MAVVSLCVGTLALDWFKPCTEDDNKQKQTPSHSSPRSAAEPTKEVVSVPANVSVLLIHGVKQQRTSGLLYPLSNRDFFLSLSLFDTSWSQNSLMILNKPHENGWHIQASILSLSRPLPLHSAFSY